MIHLFGFAGVPGGIELVIVLFIFLLTFVVPLLAVGAIIVYLYRRTKDEADDVEAERIAELEQEVSELRERVNEQE